MIQFINLGKGLGDSVERMDVVSKFELFALLINKKKIDRGLNHFQVFVDLITIRNLYVHPKIKQRALIVEKKNTYTKRRIVLNHIKISDNPEDWDIDDSQKCIKSLLHAIDDFLLNDLGLEMCSLSCMFYDFINLNGTRGPLVDTNKEWAEWCEKELKYRPKFYLDYILKRYGNI